MQSISNIKLRKPQFNSWMLFLPGVMIVSLATVFAPELFVIIPGIALFSYFWNHKDKFVIFLLIYTPFEEIVLKFLPDNLFLPMRYMWEGMLFAMMVLLLIERLVLSRTWKRSPIDYLMVIFLLTWVASAFINNISMVFAAMHLKNIIRYVPVFYFIYCLNADKKMIQAFMKILFTVAIIQSIICIGQAIEGDWFVRAFQHKSVSIGGKDLIAHSYDKNYYQYRFIGTLGANINLGNYLAFAFTFLCAAIIVYRNKTKYFAALLLVLPALFLSSSRISLLAAYGGLGFMLFFTKSKFRFAYIIIPIVLFVLVISGLSLDASETYDHFQIFNRLAFLFSPDYAEIVTSFNRGYAILFVIPKVLTTNPILGLGPGTFIILSDGLFDQQTYAKAASLGLDVSALKYVRDVGYSALIVQAGLLGLLAIVALFMKIYRKAKYVYQNSGDKLIQVFMLGSIGMIVTIAVMNWAVFTFIYRNQALLTWAMCGIVITFAAGWKKA